MRKFIERVTITGADDTVKPEDLLRVSKKYPFVEWGILMSKNLNGVSRVPSKKWLNNLLVLYALNIVNGGFNLSGHLCGQWVRDISKGKWTFINNNPELSLIFNRFQLNFHGEPHPVDNYNFISGFNITELQGKQIIFQLDNVNNNLYTQLNNNTMRQVSVAGLFDTSHGAGVLPTDWPESNEYIGYAGGLSPDNIVENIELISTVAKTEVWIDFETHARNDRDEFDLDKCVDFLEKSKPYIVGGKDE
jgi:phosphoribosylanthranilate isomerase